jgi:hypothetical protein
MESVANWDSDKEHPENAAKKVWLKEIFKVVTVTWSSSSHNSDPSY